MGPPEPTRSNTFTSVVQLCRPRSVDHESGARAPLQALLGASVPSEHLRLDNVLLVSLDKTPSWKGFCCKCKNFHLQLPELSTRSAPLAAGGVGSFGRHSSPRLPAVLLTAQATV